MRVGSFAKRLGAVEEMAQAITGEASELHLADFSPEAAQRSQKLFDLFVETLNGRAALMLRVCEKGNGLQVWNRLHKEYEAKSASRFQGMLSAIVHPEHWKTLKTAEYMEHYTKWLGDVAAYETQKNKVIEDDVKVAVIMKYAPEEVKMALR